MSLFTPTITLHFTPDEHEIITRPIVGNGGHQQFLTDLTQRIHEDALEVEDEELLRVSRYAYAYGGGGYQARFRAIMAAARRANWSGA